MEISWRDQQAYFLLQKYVTSEPLILLKQPEVATYDVARAFGILHLVYENKANVYNSKREFENCNQSRTQSRDVYCTIWEKKFKR